MVWHSSNDKIRFHFNLENLVWEPHHISLEQNDLSAAGFTFLATFNSTCCLLKMSQEGAWNINSGAFIFSAQRKGHVCRSLCRCRQAGLRELTLSQPPSAAVSRHNSWGCHVCWEAQKTVSSMQRESETLIPTGGGLSWVPHSRGP